LKGGSMSNGRASGGPQSRKDESLSAAAKFVEAYQAAPIDRIRLIKRGIPADVLEQMAKDMSISKVRLAATLGVKRANIGRQAPKRNVLSPDEGSRVLGMASLIGQVHTMISESGNPAGFNAAEWVARWIDRPLPALGGLRPAELMDTFDGQSLVSSLVSRMQSGSYC
jgi:putative toxin-antitoxin system antitoxin component (TIGR02293 family)